jgi:hypothetical protein
VIASKSGDAENAGQICSLSISGTSVASPLNSLSSNVLIFATNLFITVDSSSPAFNNSTGNTVTGLIMDVLYLDSIPSPVINVSGGLSAVITDVDRSIFSNTGSITFTINVPAGTTPGNYNVLLSGTNTPESNALLFTVS